MKYKVIGWTNYEDYDIPFKDDTIGFAERNAIIDEIRKHKYLFTGWHHQEHWGNCVPILNDGKKRGFSQRGWGGVMAEAYGQDDPYSYASYTFYESIPSNYLSFPKKGFNVDKFVAKPLENEHFDVDVSIELFNIAKKKNPFFLQDLDSLRFIDTNDTITLHCNNESLTFLVSDVDRNKKEIKFKDHHLISSKYKIIITTKPMAKVYVKTPLIINSYEANELYKQCVKQYDFNTLLELFSTFNIDVIVNKSKSKKSFATLKRFVLEYSDYAFDPSIISKVLYYINDFEFFKLIAHKVYDYTQDILINFVNYYVDKDVNLDEDIIRLAKSYKGNPIYIEKILLKAIDLLPNNKSLRSKYYKISSFMNDNGFILYMGINKINGLNDHDKKLVELDHFSTLSPSDILHIAELMAYPDNIINNDDNYCFKIPSFFFTKYECIKDGVIKYQQYVNEKFDLSNRMLELLLTGIDKCCSSYKQHLNGQESAACYVYAYDALSGFKFNLKDIARKKYQELDKFILDAYIK